MYDRFAYFGQPAYSPLWEQVETDDDWVQLSSYLLFTTTSMTQSSDSQTILDLLESSVKRFGERPALSVAFKAAVTYAGLGKKVTTVAEHLSCLGVKEGNKVAILGENSPNWAIAYLAVVSCGAIVVPILPDFPDADVRHIISEAEISYVFTTQRQVEKIYEIADGKIKQIFSLDDSEFEHFDNALKFTDLISGHRGLTKRPPKYSENRVVRGDDICAIIYTSGTSGHSKAVMLTHNNICSNVLASQKLIEIDCQWTFLSILPMSHTYEFTVGFLLPLSCGARIVYTDKPPTPTILEKICAKEKPTAMCVVPMVIEKIYKKRVVGTINSSFFLKIAMRFSYLRKKIMQKIGAKLLAFFGGELKVLAIGGAALNIEAEKFLREADFPYLVGYGLTETSPILAGGPQHDKSIKVGSVGKVVSGVKVKIYNPEPSSSVGEIYAKGPNIMQGYYKDSESTDDTIDKDGWLATGDLGYFDDLGNLYIQGRSKSVIVLAHGENIYPETIEEKINSFVQVAESLVLGNNGKLEARVYLDYDLVHKEIGNNRDKQRQYIEEILQEIKTKVNQQLPTYSKLHSVNERMEPFTKTATHKIKRYLYS